MIEFPSTNFSRVLNRTNQTTNHLPSAHAILSCESKGVVFNNPYKDAENAKIASLEKHVKMVGCILLRIKHPNQLLIIILGCH